MNLLSVCEDEKGKLIKGTMKTIFYSLKKMQPLAHSYTYEKLSLNILTLPKCNWKIVINLLHFIYYCYLGRGV